MKKSTKIFLIAAGIVLALFLIHATTLLFLTRPITELSMNKAGVFGDSFGVLTSLFSGLAFAGLIWTIFLQRQDLKIQQEQLGHQLKEMADSRSEMAVQSKIQRAQFFATKAQIRTSKILAEIEAYKIEANGLHPGAGNRKKQIEAIIKAINGLAKQIGEQAGGLDRCTLE